MANAHFAKIGDVWKHLPLLELLAHEPPAKYWETHAGSAAYSLTRSWERNFGLFRFLEHAATLPALGSSQYFKALQRLPQTDGYPTVAPGSALLAMQELGSDVESYLFCDRDPESVADLTLAAQQRGLAARVRCVLGDGVGAVWRESAVAGTDPARVVVHIDPFQPYEVTGPDGLCAIELAARLAECGFRVVYWYGLGDEVEAPAWRGWAWRILGERLISSARSAWCKEVSLTGLDCGPMQANPGVQGCGVVCANFPLEAYAACARLGRELTTVYEDAVLPTGESGALTFREDGS